MKTIVILQPGYLPWLGFFDQLYNADVFVYYDDVPYDKQGWRNRNRIKSTSGIQWLTVPVLTTGRFGQLNNEVEIDQRKDWTRKHIITVKQSYSKSPFIKEYLPELEDALQQNWQYLIDLNKYLVEMVCRWLNIKTEIVNSSALNIHGQRSERLLKICQHFNATHYLSGDAAKNYLDEELFNKNKVNILWQNFQHPVYKQCHESFEPYLSIIDLVFNEGKRSKLVLKGN
jgi:hypothetical protein